MRGNFTDVLMIDGRAYKVTCNWPEGVSIANLQELAEKAARAVNRQITIGKVTVKVDPA